MPAELLSDRADDPERHFVSGDVDAVAELTTEHWTRRVAVLNDLSSDSKFNRDRLADRIEHLLGAGMHGIISG